MEDRSDLKNADAWVQHAHLRSIKKVGLAMSALESEVVPYGFQNKIPEFVWKAVDRWLRLAKKEEVNE